MIAALGWWIEFNGKHGAREVPDQEDELWHYFQTVRVLGLWMRRFGLTAIAVAFVTLLIHVVTGGGD